MKKSILLIMLLCLCYTAIYAQDNSVRGKVLDRATGTPLPGAEVSVTTNKKQITLTNDAGEFTLQVTAANPSIMIHAAGHNDTTFRAAAGSYLTINMTVAEAAMNEVVVVGAVIRKSNLTGSVASLSADRIAATPTTNINQAIQGKLPGAYVVSNPQPGSDASIKIRGNNSIQFGTNPIFVVDGTIIDGGFSTINPDDVASIDVLKDASATALYGSRGANGVVVITTKKGRNGVGKIAYNAWVSVSEFSKKMSLMNAQQIFDLRVDAFANAYMDQNPGADRQDYINRYLLSDTSKAFAGYEFQTYRSGKSYDWLNQVVRTGVQQNHSLAFSGGSDKGNYFLSVNYTDQKGLVKSSDYKRFGGRVNIEQNVKSWLKIGTNTTFTRTNQDYVEGSVFSSAVTANPLLPIDTTGLYYLKWADVVNQDQYNPLRSLYIQGKNYSNRLITSNYVNISPVKNLNLRSTLSGDITNSETFWYTPTFTGQDQRNSYHGSASHRKDEYVNLQWDNSATYTRRIGSSNITGLVATSLQRNTYNYDQIDAYGFPNDDFGYKYLGGAYSRDRTVLASDFITTTLMSYLARADYSYNNKYFATATVRYDGSSRFGANNRWGAFPSLALAWDMSKEKFMTDVSFVNRLKWRVGYGVAGNQNIPDYAFASLYRPNYTNNSVTYVSDGRLGNPDLKWERQKQLNLGVDLAVLNNRLSFSADYFNINNDNLLMVQTLSTTTGFTNTVSNVGSLNNKGIEFNLNYAIVQNRDFHWNLIANLSTAKNKITKLYGDTKAIYNKGGYTGVEIQRTGNLFLGQSLNTIYSYKFVKIAQASDMDKIAGINFGGRTVHPGDIIPEDRDGNNIINDDDRYVVGSMDPKFYGGFGTDLGYKGFGLNAFFNYSYGLKRLSYFYESMLSSAGLSAAHTDMLNRWTPENTNTNVPRALYGIARYNVSDVDLGVQDASFLRLSVLSLSYTLPGNLSKRLLMDNARVYVTGSNLFVLTKDKGYDPETGDNYPNSRSITFGLNVSF